MVLLDVSIKMLLPSVSSQARFMFFLNLVIRWIPSMKSCSKIDWEMCILLFYLCARMGSLEGERDPFRGVEDAFNE